MRHNRCLTDAELADRDLVSKGYTVDEVKTLVLPFIDILDSVIRHMSKDKKLHIHTQEEYEAMSDDELFTLYCVHRFHSSVYNRSDNPEMVESHQSLCGVIYKRYTEVFLKKHKEKVDHDSVLPISVG